jgi:fluoroquinolone resistance protein
MDNEIYEGQNFGQNAFKRADYEQCTFHNCQFACVDLTGIIFSECQFVDCDFSNAQIGNTGFREVTFKQCKLMGVRFDRCHTLLLSFTFQNCILNFSSFYNLKMKGTKFSGCKLHEVDFTSTDLSHTQFQNCELDRATFDETVLEGADLRTALNFIINPDANRIKKARFSVDGALSLLDKYRIIVE